MKNKISLIRILNLGWLIFLLSVLLYIVLDVNNIFTTLKQVEKEKIITSAKVESPTLGALIKYGFYEEAKIEAERYFKNNNLKYLKIKSANFNLELGNKKFLKLKIPLIYNNEKIATIYIGYTNKKLIYSFANKYFTKFFIYVLILTPLFIFTVLFINKKIKKLNELAKKVEKINFRKQKSIPYLDNYYEIKNIIKAINKLLAQINNFYNTQKKLLKKLILYKKQIDTAQKAAGIFTWIYDCDEKKFTSRNFSYFTKILNIHSFNDFINHIEEKNLFFQKIENSCKTLEEFEMNLTLKNPENKKFIFKTQVKPLKDKNKLLLIGLCLDITEEIKKQEKIEYLAYHDPLTGLANRTFLKQQLKNFMSLSKRINKKLAFIFIDLDNFKMINDTFGHESGDELLREIANRLSKSIRKSDLVARIGGDEFIIVLNNIENKSQVENVVKKLQKVLKEPITLSNKKVEITFSAGICMYPDDTEDINEIFQFADIAMYESKKLGKNKFSFINISLKKEINEMYQTVEELKNALKKEDELILYFQPKIDIVKNSVVGVEALIRWNHPKKGLLTPFHFIDYAEKGGIINLIDDYVLKTAIKTLKKWEKEENLKKLSLALNISANKFNDPSFVDEIKNLINYYKIDPSKLEIEITETLSMKNINYTINTLNKIKNLNVHIAIDDFGTGYSSLNYIKELPFDVLKIDQSFIKDILRDKDDLLITKMIVEISKILNKINVAEGVENEEILKAVKQIGIRIIQGYYFSKPLPENELITFVENFGKTQ